MSRLALVALTGCGFTIGGSTPSDAPQDSLIDTPIDMPDSAIPRVTTGLIALWTFDEANNTVYAFDTSGSSQPVPLEVIRTVPAPTFSNGVLNAETTGRLVSDWGTHLAGDCRTANAVTLEVWVRPSVPAQGNMGEPTFIAGLASDVSLRDVALMQASDRWLAQVRTTTPDGKPSLVSTSSATTSRMSHVVVVANATKRALVIDGVEEAVGVPGAFTTWDPTFPMSVVDEFQHARQWRGSVALVALYARALSPAEIQQNFLAGSSH